MKIGKIILIVVLVLLLIYTLFPIGFLVINSFKPQQEIIKEPLALPQIWDFRYIINALESINFFQAFLITLVLTVTCVALIVVVSSLAAWILVRNKIKTSTVIFFCFAAAMLIPFQALMYPLVSTMDSLGLKNIFGLVVMYGGFGLSLAVFLYHGFIKGVPQGVEEAALIDGANIFQMFFRIVFPLLKSVTATIIILNVMWIWNDYLLPFLIIGNSETKTLVLELYFAKITSGQYGNPWELIFPAVLVTIAPIVLIFLFLQKYFINGISEGAIK